MEIQNLDHLVLTVANIEETVSFYQEVLGMVPTHVNGRVALKFGNQKKICIPMGMNMSQKLFYPLLDRQIYA